MKISQFKSACKVALHPCPLVNDMSGEAYFGRKVVSVVPVGFCKLFGVDGYSSGIVGRFKGHDE